MFGIDDAIMGSVAAPLIGGLLGGKGNSSGATQTSSIDPRLADAIYGSSGVVPSAQDWYAKNKTGLNPMMLQGMNNQWNQANSSHQGFNQMQNLGMGLMGAGVAGNPFSGGYTGGGNFSGGLNGNGGSIAPRQTMFNPALRGNMSSPFSAPDPVSSAQAAAKVAEEARMKSLLDVPNMTFSGTTGD
jgi:hypothetical protein